MELSVQLRRDGGSEGREITEWTLCFMWVSRERKACRGFDEALPYDWRSVVANLLQLVLYDCPLRNPKRNRLRALRSTRYQGL
jgi:hypothetical protein